MYIESELRNPPEYSLKNRVTCFLKGHIWSSWLEWGNTEEPVRECVHCKKLQFTNPQMQTRWGYR